MDKALPLNADASARRWLFEQRRAEPDVRRVLLVDLAQSGCSGWAYRPAWHASLPEAPAGFVVAEVFSDDGTDRLLLAYPAHHADKMGGVTLSYVREGLSSRLVFLNPQVTDACGCGASVHFGKAA